MASINPTSIIVGEERQYFTGRRFSGDNLFYFTGAFAAAGIGAGEPSDLSQGAGPAVFDCMNNGFAGDRSAKADQQVVVLNHTVSPV